MPLRARQQYRRHWSSTGALKELCRSSTGAAQAFFCSAGVLSELHRPLLLHRRSTGALQALVALQELYRSSAGALQAPFALQEFYRSSTGPCCSTGALQAFFVFYRSSTGVLQALVALLELYRRPYAAHLLLTCSPRPQPSGAAEL